MKSVTFLATGLLAAGSVAAQSSNKTLGSDMGPAAFMWPGDRVWDGNMDNTAPCGSIAGVTNRTSFPLSNGKVALVAQDDSYNVKLSISYSNDPRSVTDFETLITAERMAELDPGHTCVPISDPPSRIRAGSNATLQIVYIADFDQPVNQTFYACADITYVEAATFTTRIPCFNATEDDVGGTDEQDPHSGLSIPGSQATVTATPAPSADSGKLSGGAIAGIVVGVVAAVALAVAAAFLLYRKSAQKKRLEHQLHSARQNPAKADDTNQSASRASDSQPSIRLQNLSPQP